MIPAMGIRAMVLKINAFHHARAWIRLRAIVERVNTQRIGATNWRTTSIHSGQGMLLYPAAMRKGASSSSGSSVKKIQGTMVVYIWEPKVDS
jgi:hypothetical protein